jgi:hypothetical protein
MNAVITLGIDMSSQPKGTAACAVTWEADRAVTVTPCLGCDDEMLSEMIAKSDAVGIDAPFGWPAEFALAVGAWSFTFWTPQLRERLCFREDRSSCARNRGTLAAERLCGSDRAAGDAYIRAVGPPWSYGSQRRQQVLRGLSSRQFEPVGVTSRGYKKNRPDHKEARETILAAYARRCRGWSCQMLAPRPGLGKPPANRNRVGLCGFGAVDEGAVFSLVILLSNRSYAARLLLFATIMLALWSRLTKHLLRNRQAEANRSLKRM